MKIYRQKPPLSPYRSAFELKVWKKKVYIEGWYVWVQIGQRAWRLHPSDKKGPPKP